MTIGVGRIWPGPARHQQFLQIAFVYYGDFLGADAFVINGVSTEQRRAMKILGAGIVDKAYGGWQHARANSTGPIALSAKAAEHLLNDRLKRQRGTRAIHRRAKYLAKHWRRGASLKQHRTGVILGGPRSAPRPPVACLGR